MNEAFNQNFYTTKIKNEIVTVKAMFWHKNEKTDTQKWSLWNLPKMDRRRAKVNKIKLQ